MPRRLLSARELLGLSIRVNPATPRNLKRKLGGKKIKPLLDTHMREIATILRAALMRALTQAFPSSASSGASGLRRSLVSKYSAKSGRIKAGFDTKGIVNPVTGRPLSEYIIPIQRFGAKSRKRTRPPNPPIIGMTPTGRLWVSKIVRNRLAPWAQGLGKANAFAFAIAVARRIQQEGVPRRPLLSKVFNLAIVSVGPTGIVTGIIDPQAKGEIARSRDKMRRNIKRTLGK